jgi:hypothetical protein
MLAAELRDVQGVADVILHGLGKLAQVLRLDPIQITDLIDGAPVIGRYI